MLHLAASLLLGPAGATPTPTPPSGHAVQRKAQSLRSAMFHMASEALAYLPPLKSVAEHVTGPVFEVYNLAHDFTHPHHDKDVRSVGIFTPTELQGYNLYTIVVNLDGGTTVECLQLPAAPHGKHRGDLFGMVHRGHYTALAPVKGAARRLRQAALAAGAPVADLRAVP